jgi:hypothetical protein
MFGHDDQEFISAVSHYVAVILRDTLKQSGKGNQNDISDIMTECIIAEFEVVKVNVQKSEADIISYALADKGGIFFYFFGKALSVEQSRQQIRHGTLPKLFIHLIDLLTGFEPVQRIGQLTECRLEDHDIVPVKENNAACHVFMQFDCSDHQTDQFISL